MLLKGPSLPTYLCSLLLPTHEIATAFYVRGR